MGMFYVPEDKISKLTLSIEAILVCYRVCIRKLASIIGQITSMGLAIGPVPRLRTRALYHILNSRWFWSDILPLAIAARDELLFWKSSLAVFNGQPIWFSHGATCMVFLDANSTGFVSLKFARR